jgi:hypothetical protein
MMDEVQKFSNPETCIEQEVSVVMQRFYWGFFPKQKDTLHFVISLNPEV